LAFVWNDGVGRLSSSQNLLGSGVTGPHTFHVGAVGGVRITTGGGVTFIPGNGAGWSTTSSRAAKTNIDPVDPERVLAGVEAMEVSTWELEDEDGDGQGTRHIGPMAEDFHEVVEIGDSDDHINSINADGVAFAAIQGLAQELDEKDARIDELEAENEQLRDRLSGVEDRLASLETGQSSPGIADE